MRATFEHFLEGFSSLASHIYSPTINTPTTPMTQQIPRTISPKPLILTHEAHVTSLSLHPHTNPMKLSTSKTINAPAERLWHLLTHLNYWTKWGTSIAKVSADSDTISLGTCGLITPRVLPIALPFHVHIFEPDHYHWAWQVQGFEATSHTVTPLSAHSCEVSFAVPHRHLAPYLLICKRALTNLEQLATSPEVIRSTPP